MSKYPLSTDRLPRFPLGRMAHLALGLVLVLVTNACEREAPVEPLAKTPTAIVTWYASSTPSRTPLPPTPERYTATPPFTSTPSPTPFTHVITKGDTMGSISLKYGVNLQELLAANPEVDPHFMTIGKAVIIPLKVEEQGTAAQPTLTPVIVRTDPARCYLTAEGGAWCFVLVTNDQDQAVENLSAWIGLFRSTGELVVSQTALAPLNLLRPAQSVPLAAHFAAPLPAGFTARQGAISALPVAGEKARYLPAEVDGLETEIAPGGTQAVVKGKILLPGGKSPAGVVWLAVIAYGADGGVVGMRKWEGNALGAQETPFEITVFSLGPAIERVEVLVEARPMR